MGRTPIGTHNNTLVTYSLEFMAKKFELHFNRDTVQLLGDRKEAVTHLWGRMALRKNCTDLGLEGHE